jgi:hypothetical protein
VRSKELSLKIRELASQVRALKKCLHSDHPAAAHLAAANQQLINAAIDVWWIAEPPVKKEVPAHG